MNFSIKKDDEENLDIKAGDIIVLKSSMIYLIQENVHDNQYYACQLNLHEGSGRVLGTNHPRHSVDELIDSLTIVEHYPASEWELVLKRKEEN